MQAFKTFFRPLWVCVVAVLAALPTCSLEAQPALVADPEHWELDIVKTGFEPSFPSPLLADWLDNGDLVVMGIFSSVDQASTWGVARWDGVKWNDQDESPINYVSQSVRSGDMWWINGWHTNTIGILEPALLEKRNGRWRPLLVQPHTTSGIRAMVSDGKGLYIGGRFREVGDQAITNLAYWDGTRWNAVGGGIQQYQYPVHDGFSESGYVTALALDGTNLYVGGNFLTAGSNRVSNIARWDGHRWDDMNGGMRRKLDDPLPQSNQLEVRAILVRPPLVYAVGGFNFAGGKRIVGLARWNGHEWGEIGNSDMDLNTGASRIAWVGDYLFLEGNSSRIGGKALRVLARWDGREWLPMFPPTMRGFTYMIAASDTELVFGVMPAVDFGFAQHHGLAIYHVPPKLAVERRPEGPRVYWPGPAWHYRLERSASLTEGSWTLAPNPQDGPGRIRYVDLPKDRPSTFFRLRRIPGLRDS